MLILLLLSLNHKSRNFPSKYYYCIYIINVHENNMLNTLSKCIHTFYLLNIIHKIFFFSLPIRESVCMCVCVLCCVRTGRRDLIMLTQYNLSANICTSILLRFKLNEIDDMWCKYVYIVIIFMLNTHTST